MPELLDLLWQTHQDPASTSSADLAHAAADLSFDAGQQLQTRLLQRWLDHGASLGGWKIGMTSGASRNAMGPGIRPFGYILQQRIVESGGRLNVADLHTGQVENELCLLIDKPLGKGTTRADVIAATGGLLPAFEINQKRLGGQADPGLRVADNLSNWGIVIGAPVPVADALQNMTVTLSGPDGVIERVASAGHIDDHFESVAILANRLADFGFALQPGQYVITGAYGKTPFAPGCYRGDFDCGVGQVEINLL